MLLKDNDKKIQLLTYYVLYYNRLIRSRGRTVGGEHRAVSCTDIAKRLCILHFYFASVNVDALTGPFALCTGSLILILLK